MPYNPQITVNQHCVPSHFLFAWCNRGVLWVSNKDFKLFQQKPENVAKCKMIYSSEHMTADEFIACFSAVANLAKRVNPELSKLIMDGMVSDLLYDEISNGQLTSGDFNRIVSFIVARNLCSDSEVARLKLVWIICERGYILDETKWLFRKRFVEGIEPIVTRVEQIAYPLIERLRCGESAFIAEVENRESFFLYVALQLFRVKRFTDYAENYRLINYKTLKLSRLILVTRALDFLMRNWTNDEFCVVDNPTDLEFITGDNPICNLDEHDRSKYLDLYFPISPSKAVFMCNKDRVSLYPEMKHMTIQYVHELNRKLSANCTYQVFAKSKDTLQFGGYKPLFDPIKAAMQVHG